VADLPAAAARVQAALNAAGSAARVIGTGTTARTADEAAAAVGTTTAQIVKSLVFTDAAGPVMLLVSGANRVDTTRLGLRRLDADGVRAATGFAIGGVSPLAHPAPLPILIDEDLLAYDTVWAAAGTPNHVFAISPNELVAVTHATVVRVTPDP
jgi:prolyl-tRNA editing enzyme YbaK/EbsC (Cys-tRNA(Pro) deacylase)